MSMLRDYRLALDINTSAIGLVTYRLNEDNQPDKLEHIDVHVFGEPIADAKTGKLKKALRREKRLMRRQVKRRAQRLKKIAHLFTLVGTTSEQVRDVQKKQRNRTKKTDEETVHKWRSDAVTQEITPEQLMSVFLLMAKNRGYEGRFTKAEDGKVKTHIDEVKKRMQDRNCDTLGQLLYKYKTDAQSTHPKAQITHRPWKKLSEEGTYAQRDMLQDEFSRIWEEQERHHTILKPTGQCDEKIEHVYRHYFEDNKSILPKNTKESVSLRDLFYSALFDQRPIWWDKETIGSCELEPEYRRASRAHPVFQEYRIEQLLNDLELKRSKRELREEEKEKIRPIFEQQKEITAKKLYDILGISNDRFTHDRSTESGNDDHKFKGNKTRCVLCKLEKEVDMQLDDRERELFIEIIADIDEPSFFGNEHWHECEEVREYFSDAYTQKNNESVIAFIKKLYEKGKLETLRAMKFDTGRANYSVQALRKLLPHMREGSRPDEARDREYPRWRERQADNLKRVGDSVVQQALEETKKAIDYAIKKHGGQLPAQVVVELSRDMKLSQKKRKIIEGVQQNQKNARDKARKELEKTGANPSDKLCTKYILWQEQQKICPYCGDPLPVTKIANETTEIDHIVPEAYGGQYNHANLAVVHQTCNQKKSGKLPLEAFSNKSIKAMSDAMKKPSYLTKPFNAYKKAVEKRANLLLIENKDNLEGDFKLRQNHETAWIGRELTAYLKRRLNINTTDKGTLEDRTDKGTLEDRTDKGTLEDRTDKGTLEDRTDKGTLEDRVYITKGTLTAYLRRVCGLDTLIADIRKEEGKPVFNRQREVMEDGGSHAGSWHHKFEDYEKRYEKRSDHRHHAVDAAVIGLVDRNMFKKATKYYKENSRLKGFETKISLQNTIRSMLKQRLHNYVVWHKPDRMPIDGFFDEQINRCKSITLQLKDAEKLSELAADTYEATKKNLETGIVRGNSHLITEKFEEYYRTRTEKNEKTKCRNALAEIEKHMSKFIRRKKLSELAANTYDATKKNIELIAGEHVKQHIIEEFETRYKNLQEQKEIERCKHALCGTNHDDGIFYPANTRNKVKSVRVYHKVSSAIGHYNADYDKCITVHDAWNKEHKHVLNNNGYACFEIRQDDSGKPTYKPVPYHVYWTKNYQTALKNDDAIVRIYKNDIIYDRKSKEYYVVKKLVASQNMLKCIKTTETMTYGAAPKELIQDFGTNKIVNIQLIKSRKNIVDSMNTHESSSDCST